MNKMILKVKEMSDSELRWQYSLIRDKHLYLWDADDSINKRNIELELKYRDIKFKKIEDR